MANVGQIIVQPRGVSTQLFELPPECGIAFGDWTTLPTASEEFRGIVVRTEGGAGVADQIVVCRKNADDAYEWIPVGVSETTLVLWYLQDVAEASNPQNITSPVDPYAGAFALNLTKFSQGRLRATIDDDPGTAGVTGTLQYTADAGSSWHTFMANTLDFSQVTQTTEWEDLAAGAVGNDIMVGVRLAMAGAGSANTKVTLFLDLRG